MQWFWKWYFEKCRLSVLILVGAVLWTALACWMLQQSAPAIYVASHVLTTGVFFFLVLRNNIDSSQPPADKTH